MRKMEKLLERSLRFVYADLNSSYQQLLEKSSLASLEIERKKQIVIEAFKIKHDIAPKYLKSLVVCRHSGYGTRQSLNLELPKYNRITYGKNSLKFMIPYLWNDLPFKTKALTEMDEFRSDLKTWKGPVCRCNICKFQESMDR